MSDSLLKNVAVFANANGSNSYAKTFLEVLASYAQTQLTVIALAEKLPEYARFPSANRKSRLEELIQTAAASAAEELVEFAQEQSITCAESTILGGRFPKALVDWIDSSSTTLVVKESLACDGTFGNASKGDIKLTRQSSAPVLLVHSPIRHGDPVIVGIAPHVEDTTLDGACISLIESAAFFAKLLGGMLCVVHAWDLWGESLIRSRVPFEEIEESKKELKEQAERSVDRILSQSTLHGVVPERILGKGDATRVLSGAIDVIKPGLVVLGSTAKEGVRGALLGNTAESIARQKQSSVLIVR